MVHTVLAAVLRYLLWVRETLGAVEYGIIVPTEGGSFATDVFASKSVFSRALRLPTAKEIWEARTLTAGTLLGLVIILVVRYVRSPWRKVPPSPRRFPIIGNAHQLMDKPWLVSKDCKERFGKSLIISTQVDAKVGPRSRGDHVSGRGWTAYDHVQQPQINLRAARTTCEQLL